MCRRLMRSHLGRKRIAVRETHSDRRTTGYRFAKIMVLEQALMCQWEVREEVPW